MSISLIAAIAKNNTIGNNNELLWKIPVDMKHFKETTSLHPVIMGKKTFESIGRLLPNRKNIIITRDPNYSFEGAVVYNSLDEALNLFKDSEEEAFVIGGGEIYRQSLPQASKLYITHVEKEFDGDTFFPEISKADWKEESVRSVDIGEETPYPLRFVNYVRV